MKSGYRRRFRRLANPTAPTRARRRRGCRQFGQIGINQLGIIIEGQQNPAVVPSHCVSCHDVPRGFRAGRPDRPWVVGWSPTRARARPAVGPSSVRSPGSRYLKVGQPAAPRSTWRFRVAMHTETVGSFATCPLLESGTISECLKEVQVPAGDHWPGGKFCSADLSPDGEVGPRGRL